MKIEWNKVTWYSKLAAVVLFVGVAVGAFWFGRWYEDARHKSRDQESAVSVSQNLGDQKTIQEINLPEVLIKEISLDFHQAVSINGKGPAVQSLFVNWVQKDATRIRGVEILPLENEPVTFISETNSNLVPLPARIVSVGKYSEAVDYRGIFWPYCSGSSSLA